MYIYICIYIYIRIYLYIYIHIYVDPSWSLWRRPPNLTSPCRAGSGSNPCREAYINTCIHTYIHTEIHTRLITYGNIVAVLLLQLRCCCIWYSSCNAALATCVDPQSLGCRHLLGESFGSCPFRVKPTQFNAAV